MIRRAARYLFGQRKSRKKIRIGSLLHQKGDSESIAIKQSMEQEQHHSPRPDESAESTTQTPFCASSPNAADAMVSDGNIGDDHSSDHKNSDSMQSQKLSSSEDLSLTLKTSCGTEQTHSLNSSPRLPISSAAARREKRAANQQRPRVGVVNNETNALSDQRFTKMLAQNEDELLNFVAKVNKVYQEKLKKPAPFMTFVFCGMQSSGKSTVMERFMNAVLNIVQEGTGTRCPLDTTCIHDETCLEPSGDLSGNTLLEGQAGKGLSMQSVFERITAHNKMLGSEDRFCTEPLYLVYRASNVQNMRFVDTPGIISNLSTGKDNRQDIKTILRSEMMKPNTKICVLLEPKEFATNSIVQFCDESLGGREKWISNAIFLMTKFDKQLDDSRTGTKVLFFFVLSHYWIVFKH